MVESLGPTVAWAMEKRHARDTVAGYGGCLTDTSSRLTERVASTKLPTNPTGVTRTPVRQMMHARDLDCIPIGDNDIDRSKVLNSPADTA